MTAVLTRGKDVVQGVARSHALKTWQTYVTSRGNVLAGGMAYAGLFSVFSALLVGFTAFGIVLGRNSELQEPVLQAIDEQLPGLLDLGDGGLVTPDALFAQDVLSVTGAVALLVALWSGLGWLDATRQGIRSVFDLPFDDRSLLKKKVGDLGILATLGFAILASSLISVGVNAVAGVLIDAAGLGEGWLGRAVLRVLGILVVLAVDTAILVVLFRLLSRVPLMWSQARTGALVGAIGLGALKLFGGLLLGGIGGGNPLLATSAVLVGLLVWMNLMSRVVLLAAAWVATEDEVRDEAAAVQERGVRAGAGDDPARPAGPRDLPMPSFGQPSYGQRAADRTTLAAGAVLGVLASYAARTLSAAARTVAEAARRED